MKKTYRFTFLVALVFISLATVLLATIFLGYTENSYAAAELDVCATCTYTTIQDAIEAANNDDTIRVAEGTYTGMMSSSGVTATVILTKNLTLMGGFSPDFSQRDPDVHITTIDTQGNTWGGVCICGSQSAVDGFHIINADGGGVAITDNQGITAVGTVTNNRIANNRIVTDTQLNKGGAGIDIANGAEATITNNEIVSNTIERSGSYGGGIRIISATAEIYENTIAYNLTYSDTVGGGIDVYRSTVVITGNNVHHNANMGIGIYRSVAEVMSNTVDSNTTVFGGGGIDINSESTFTLTGNIISNNLAQQYNGGGIGIFGDSVGVISQNQIIGNHTVGGGGGIGAWDSGKLDIDHNNIRLNTAGFGGGGIDIDGNHDGDDQPLTIEYNTIYSNTSEYNVGISISRIDAVILILGNDIRFNQVVGADYQSGGIYIDDTGAMVTVVNNIVAHNDNRGVKGVNYTEIKLINNTIVGNGSQAIEMHAWPISSTIPMTATVVNNIIADHPDCAFSGFFNAVFAVYNNDVVGHDPDDCGAVIIAQSDNINADPLFADEVNGDYHLTSESPVIDNGRTGVDIPVVDIEGNNRPQGNGVDMGAYEAARHQIFLPTILRPSVPPSDNYIIETIQPDNYYISDAHAWLSAADGWGFTAQLPTGVEFYHWNGTDWSSYQTLPNGGSAYFYGTELTMLSATDGWAVAPRNGTGGPSTFFRWDGSQWTENQAGIGATITSMDFRSTDDGWAAGNASCCGAKFFHWDGTSWTEGDYLHLDWPASDIALLSDGDGWAVGSTIARKSGNSWAVYGSPVSESLTAISMVSATDGWIVGNAGTILRWNGSAWSTVTSPTSEDLRDVEMVQGDHGWAVGGNGTILRWNGTDWSLVTSPVNANFYELDITGTNEGWIPYYDSTTSSHGLLHITTP